MARLKITAKEAARRVHRAKKDLDAAREALAQAPSRAPHHVFAAEWQVANSALERSRGALTKIPGVVGHGLGHRIKAGIETDTICVVVFVREKKTLASLKRDGSRRVPKSLAHGKKRIATDVIQMGPLVKQDAMTGPAGPGSIAFPRTGGGGTIAALGTDLDTGKPMVITAMHVTGGHELDIPLDEAINNPALEANSPVGGPTVGHLVRGTTTGIDAAKVVLDDSVDLSTLPQILRVRPISEDDDTAVHLYGSASQQILNGTIKYLNVNLIDNGESLVNTILASIPTVSGDSGAGLVDDSGYLLGILYGLAPTTLRLPPPTLPQDLRVFSPAAAVMSRLRCSIP